MAFRTAGQALGLAMTLLNTASAETSLREAQSLFDAADFERCRAAVGEILADTAAPAASRRDAWMLAGRCEFALGQPTEARRAFCQALEIDPYWRPSPDVLLRDEIRAFDQAMAECGPAARAQVAGDEARERSRRAPSGVSGSWVGIQARGGMGRYGMNDVQAYAETVNSAAASYGVPLSLGAPGSGVQYGLAGCAGWGHWRTELAAERLSGTSSSGSPGVLSWQLELPANVLSATVLYDVSVSEHWTFAVGAGIGRYWSSGKETVRGSGTAQTFNWTGSGVGVHGLSMAERSVAAHLRLQVRAGWRAAKASHVSDGTGGLAEDFEIDWSGPFLAGGLMAFRDK